MADSARNDILTSSGNGGEFRRLYLLDSLRTTYRTLGDTNAVISTSFSLGKELYLADSTGAALKILSDAETLAKGFDQYELLADILHWRAEILSMQIGGLLQLSLSC